MDRNPDHGRPHTVLLLLRCLLSYTQVCQEATRHFAKQPQLSFLSDIPPPPAPTSDDSSASDAPVTAAADSANKDATQLDKASLWISNAQSVDLVWLYFALYKHYHHAK
jgi:hypothetical protein